MTLSQKSRSVSHKPHIVFLYYYFPPMGGGGVQRIVKWLKYLDYSRLDVSVITVKESHYYAADPSLLQEIPDAVRIVRTDSFDPFRLAAWLKKGDTSPKNNELPRESSDWLRRLSAAVFIPDSRVGWFPFALMALWHLHREHPIDGVVASMPPYTAGLVGAAFHAWQQVPLILDYRDAWCGNAYFPKRPGMVEKIHQWLEKTVLNHASGVVFVNPALQRHVKARYPLNTPGAQTVIRNGFDPDDFRDLPVPPPAPPVRVGILGSVYSRGNRPLLLLNAISTLVRDEPELKDRLRVCFIGKWSPGFLEFARKFPFPEMIEWHPYLPHHQALQEAAKCHALSLTIEDIPGSHAITPGRIYEYLALRRPVLAICPPGSDLASLVESTGAGTVIAPNDLEGLKQAIRALLRNPDAFTPPENSGYLTTFSRQEQTQQLYQFLQHVLDF